MRGISPLTMDPGLEDLRALTRREHRYLDLLADEVAAALDRSQLAWASFFLTTLEHAVQAHLSMEERHLFPWLARERPEEVRGLRDEHRGIRERLAELSSEALPPGERADALRALIASMHEHAVREDAVLYPWAAENLDASEHADLRQRVRERLDVLADKTRPLRLAHRAA